MKRTPLYFAAFVPVAAIAAGQGGGVQIDYNELRDDLQATTLLGTNVQAEDGSDVGSIADIMLDASGGASIIIQREGEFALDDVNVIDDEARDGAGQTGAVGEDRQDAALGEADMTDMEAGMEETGADQGMDPDRAGSMEVGDEFVKVEWNRIQYNAEEESASLKGGLESADPVAYEQTGELDTSDSMVRASMLIGMEVNLADEDSFGEVEDVMLDPSTGKASALVIDSMEFFDKERYAVPVNLDQLNPAEEELTLQYTQQELEQLGEFEMEAATNQL